MKKHWIDSFDFFGVPIPGLNFESRSSIGTWVGVLVTICLFTTQLLYTGLRFTQLITKHNPQITVAEETGVFLDEKHGLDVSNHNFTLAFGVSDYLTNEPKFAKNLLHWQVEVVQSEGDLGSD
jgi:hypothetical protein